MSQAPRSRDQKVWPRRGNFGGQVVVSPFEPDAESMQSDATLFGMPPQSTFVGGTLRDDTGKLYALKRRIQHSGEPTSQRHLFMLTAEGDLPDLRLHPAGRSAASSENVVRGLTPSGAGAWWESHPDAAGAPFRLEWRPDGCTWIEKGTFTLEGIAVRPGMQWYLPDANRGLAYIGTMHLLTGTVLGRPCRGFMGFDQIYMYPGRLLYSMEEPLIGDQLEMLWYTWATRYSDGSLEAGHFMLGHDKLGFAILTDEHENVRMTTDIDGEVHFDEYNRWQTGSRFSMAGQDFEFLPDPLGRMHLGPIPNPQVDGRWRRVGDTREPDVWFAWGEAVPQHGVRPTNRFSF